MHFVSQPPSTSIYLVLISGIVCITSRLLKRKGSRLPTDPSQPRNQATEPIRKDVKTYLECSRIVGVFVFSSILELEQQRQQPTSNGTNHQAGRDSVAGTSEKNHTAAGRGSLGALGGIGASQRRRAVSCRSRRTKSCSWSGGRGRSAGGTAGCQAHHGRGPSCCRLSDELNLRDSDYAGNDGRGG